MSEERDPRLSPHYTKETAAPFSAFQMQVWLLGSALDDRDGGLCPNRIRFTVLDQDGYPITPSQSMPASVIPELKKAVAEIYKQVKASPREGVIDINEFRARKARRNGH